MEDLASPPSLPSPASLASLHHMLQVLGRFWCAVCPFMIFGEVRRRDKERHCKEEYEPPPAPLSFGWLLETDGDAGPPIHEVLTIPIPYVVSQFAQAAGGAACAGGRRRPVAEVASGGGAAARHFVGRSFGPEGPRILVQVLVLVERDPPKDVKSQVLDGLFCSKLKKSLI